tara:strand:+ start:129 stop:383 length:255 start_codon:yes stop_codon:yes gene_type:complete
MSWKEIIKEWTEQDSNKLTEYANRPYANPSARQSQNKTQMQTKIKEQIEKLTAEINRLKQQEQALEQGTPNEMPIQQNRSQNFE